MNVTPIRPSLKFIEVSPTGEVVAASMPKATDRTVLGQLVYLDGKWFARPTDAKTLGAFPKPQLALIHLLLAVGVQSTNNPLLDIEEKLGVNNG